MFPRRGLHSERAEWEVVVLDGLPTLFDVMVTYDPNAAGLSWQVPPHPEALPSSDSFDVYTGDMTTVSDLSQAIPVDCMVPAGRTPVPGEHLSVADTAAVPQPGEATYFLVATEYQGQGRAGRETSNGRLKSRNGALLPQRR